jgi:hypothetical protein
VFGELVRLGLRMGVDGASSKWAVDCVDELCDLILFGGFLDTSGASDGSV